MSDSKLIKKCRRLLKAFEDGKLGQTEVPEDAHPEFQNKNERITYFSLPMALNYQRNSYTLWESALETFKDEDAKKVFDVSWAAEADEDELREKLLQYKLGLQPNKHIQTWQRISQTVSENWGTFENLIIDCNSDFLKLKEALQVNHKKGFPYLSGPKIFNYWSFILSTYGGVGLKNRDQIDIAPDTHITKCSVKLGVITEAESKKLSKDEISERWRELLTGSGIDPIDMHPPLWFWSRNGFIFDLDK